MSKFDTWPYVMAGCAICLPTCRNIAISMAELYCLSAELVYTLLSRTPNHRLSMYRSQIDLAEIDPWKNAKD